MYYLEFLRGVHERLKPRSYLEIGVRHGDSLALSSAPAIGIDPSYELRVKLPPTARLSRTTSNDFFRQDDVATQIPGGVIDLAFIDGMHLFEFALEDLANVERFSGPGSAVVLDDVLPRTSQEAQRERTTSEWTGDVWKVIPALSELRPDLVVIQVATRPTGSLIILNLDPTNTTLTEHHSRLVDQFDGTSTVPDSILRRSNAVDPRELLEASFWEILVRARGADFSDVAGTVRGWTPTPLTPEQVEESKVSRYRGHLLRPPGMKGLLERGRRRFETAYVQARTIASNTTSS